MGSKHTAYIFCSPYWYNFGYVEILRKEGQNKISDNKRVFVLQRYVSKLIIYCFVIGSRTQIITFGVRIYIVFAIKIQKCHKLKMSHPRWLAACLDSSMINRPVGSVIHLSARCTATSGSKNANGVD